MNLITEMGILHRKNEWDLNDMKRYQFLLNKFRGGNGRTKKEDLSSPSITPLKSILENE